MTILAGAWSAGRSRLPAELGVSLVSALSRQEGDRPWIHEVPGCLLAKVDVGAFGEPAAVRGPDGSALILAGEPLVDRGDGVPWRSRQDDAAYLHDRLMRGRVDVLARATGTYCLAQYDPKAHLLRTGTDQLGARPLYEARIGDVVVFASALRILEQIGLELHLDLRGAVELTILQAPLGRRTAYREVRLLGPAEVSEHSAAGHEILHSREWDRIREEHVDRGAALGALDGAFRQAVARRRRDDLATNALLSGGLDSRMIVTALRGAGLEVRTLNFSLVGSLDHVIGGLYADAVGTRHEAHPYHAGLDDSYEDMTARLLRASTPAGAVAPERPALIWAGNGGSSVVGQANIHPDDVALLRAGKTAEAVDAFFARKGGHTPTRLFRSPFAARMQRATRDAVIAELGALSPEDPGRRLEIYQLRNATRVQLHAHHEETDRRRIEQQTPFFDAELVRTALAIPYAFLARHGLYREWVELCGGPAASIPWQALPGHAPCPHPMPEGALPQWDLARGRGFRRRALLLAAQRLIREGSPREVLARGYLAIVTTLHAAGIRDYGYAIVLADALNRWWHRSGARPVPLPEIAASS